MSNQPRSINLTMTNEEWNELVLAWQQSHGSKLDRATVYVSVPVISMEDNDDGSAS